MSERSLPLPQRLHLTHACVQAIARSCNADLLHIKGPAVHRSLLHVRQTPTPEGETKTTPWPRQSTDADIIVRPSHAQKMQDAFEEHGWNLITHFETGSVFEHAACWWHNDLGYADLHRSFPGIRLDPEEAFDRMWQKRQIIELAHAPCAVPCVSEQRLLLLLHAARGGGATHPDAQLLWASASEEAREECLALASQYHAEVALAAATGRLHEFQQDPTADLWGIFLSEEPPRRLDEWKARIKAADGWKTKLSLLFRAFSINKDHAKMRQGRPLTHKDIAAEYAHRFSRSSVEIFQSLFRRSKGLK